MTNQLHALLVGIDCYSAAPENNLAGAVADAEAMYRFLLRSGVPPGNMRRLLSPLPSSDVGSGDGLPTYVNLVQEIEHLAQRAVGRGDRVLLCYSGHGARTATLLTDEKGDAGLDEALVPCDLGTPGSRWLRDVELTFLLDSMLRRGLHVTVILDACHSGGMMRHHGPRCRRRRLADPELHPSPSSGVADPAALAAAWRGVHRQMVQHEPATGPSKGLPSWSAGPIFRHAEAPPSGWLAPAVLRRGGITLLAACSSRQEAMEHLFAGRMRGALSYTLLQELESPGSGQLTWRRLHLQLAAALRRLESPEIPLQTPVLEGDTSQLWFAAEAMGQQTVAVTAVDTARRRLLLGVGQAWNIGPGAIFELLATDAHGAWRLEVESTAASEAVARRLGDSSDVAAVRVGDAARCLSPGDAARTPVVFISEDDLGGAAVPGRDRRRDSVLRNGRLLAARSDDVLRWLQQAVESPPPGLLGTGFLRLEGSADGFGAPSRLGWQVRLRRGYCRICHWHGTPLAGLHEMPVLTPRDAAAVVAKLAHMARFEHLRSLANDDIASTLAATLSLRLARLSESRRPDEAMRPMPLPTDRPVVSPEQPLALGIGSSSHRGLYVQVMSLRRDWSVVRLYPQGSEQLLVEGPGWTWLPITCHASPPGCGVETFKVIATVEPMAMAPWTLPPLDQPSRGPMRGGGKGSGGGAWGATTRFTHGADDWTTASLDVVIEPPAD